MEKGNSESGEDWMPFVAADRLNAVANASIDPLEMMRLNLHVGETAVKVSALVPASGTGAIGNNPVALGAAL
jgi:hypothetical protein